MIVPLQYGKGGLNVAVPEGFEVTVIEKPSMPVVCNHQRKIQSALNSAVSSPALRLLAEQSKTACVLVCDITRPVPNHLLIPPILETLLEAGIKGGDILLLIATGLHRPNVGEELCTLLGDSPLLESIRVDNHDGRDDEMHVYLGRTANGTQIKLDRRFVDADLKLVTGLVEPHFMAGFSGGRKVIVPGVAHDSTIRTLHNSKFLSDPRCRACEVETNPLHSELLTIIAQLRQHCGTEIYGVNVVIDADRRLSFVNFGELETSHDEAMTYSSKYSVVKLDRQYPIVLTTGAGYPLDQTYYQSIKGLVTPLDIIEPNGTLILAAECKDGLGSQSFQQSQLKLCQDGTESFLHSIKHKPQADIDEWSTQMLARVQQRVKIMLYSDGLTQAQFELTGAHRIISIEQGLKHALCTHGSGNVAVIPEGPYVVPTLSL